MDREREPMICPHCSKMIVGIPEPAMQPLRPQPQPPEIRAGQMWQKRKATGFTQHHQHAFVRLVGTLLVSLTLDDASPKRMRKTTLLEEWEFVR
jgi:hypothetical protein